MTATVQRWGNSLAVRIPKLAAQDARLTLGTTVEIEQTPKGLLIRPARRRRKYTLQQLLAQCRGKTPPPDVDWGPPVGDEAW
jgi:antitoxin MazE